MELCWLLLQSALCPIASTSGARLVGRLQMRRSRETISDAVTSARSLKYNTLRRRVELATRGSSSSQRSGGGSTRMLCKRHYCRNTSTCMLGRSRQYKNLLSVLQKQQMKHQQQASVPKYRSH